MLNNELCSEDNMPTEHVTESLEKLAVELFKKFARMEYALKAAGFMKKAST